MEAGKILLVEEQQATAGTLKPKLVKSGYQVVVAHDVARGYRLFQEQSFNLVLLDLHPPVMNGYGLCRRIRAADAQIPIMILATSNSLNEKINGYNAGADDYLVKPFDFKELLLKIRVLLKRTLHQSVPAGSVLKAAGLYLNTESKEVIRNGVPIQLTVKEFQLLEYLLRHQNRVVSRAEIAANVWGIDFETNTNIVDVYISYLRHKIDKPFASKLIHTQVGMGYVLKEK